VGENTSTGERSIWIMQNGAEAYSITLSTIRIQWLIVAEADFFGSGQADLVWENISTGEHSIWVMRNGTPSSTISLPTISVDWEIVD
jgi:hypothetical protein